MSEHAGKITANIKYNLEITFKVKARVEEHDIIGAVYSNLNSMLGELMEIYQLQKQGKVGYLVVKSLSYKPDVNETTGKVSLDTTLPPKRVSILAAAIETIDKIGPGEAVLEVQLSDRTCEKREQIVEKATKFFRQIQSDKKHQLDLVEKNLETQLVPTIISFRLGTQTYDAGPSVRESSSLILVEGRNDVRRLLELQQTNVLAIRGHSKLHPELIKFCRAKTQLILLMDNDNQGMNNLKHLLQHLPSVEIALGPPKVEVEDFTEKQFLKAIQNLKRPSALRELREQEQADTKEMTESSEESETVQDQTTQSEANDVHPVDSIDEISSSEESSGIRSSPSLEELEAQIAGTERSGSEVSRRDRRGSHPSAQEQGEGGRPRRNRERGRSNKEHPSEDSFRTEPVRPTIPASDIELFDTLHQLEEREAWFIDSNNQPVKKVPVSELIPVLTKTRRKLAKLFLNGVATQRLIDLCESKEILELHVARSVPELQTRILRIFEHRNEQR